MSSTSPSIKSESPSTISPAIATKDFGFIPIPRRCRFNPDNPAKLTLYLNLLFAVTSTLAVSNFFLSQPILVTLGETFHAAEKDASHVPLFQSGGLLMALFFICPMGDTVRRRPLLLTMVAATVVICFGLGFSNSLAVFKTLSFLLGAFCQGNQILGPMVVDIADEGKKGRALTVIFSGQLLGLSTARVLSGLLSSTIGWRYVYYLSGGVQAILVVILYFSVPDRPAKTTNGYLRNLMQMFKLLTVKNEPLLLQCMFCGFLASSTFTGFWNTLSFLLKVSPYHYTDLQIGLLGLLGLTTAAFIPILGLFVDRVGPYLSACAGALNILVGTAFALPLAPLTIGGIIVAAFFIDLGVQCLHVSNLIRCQSLDRAHTSKLNSIYLITAALGQFAGTEASTSLYLKAGTRPTAALWLGWSVAITLLYLIRGPHIARNQWIGWNGCYSISNLRKPSSAADDDATIHDKDEELEKK